MDSKGKALAKDGSKEPSIEDRLTLFDSLTGIAAGIDEKEARDERMAKL